MSDGRVSTQVKAARVISVEHFQREVKVIDVGPEVAEEAVEAAIRRSELLLVESEMPFADQRC